nr:DUF3566 domain-containing protein [Rhodococcus sp. MSC1_016]
MSTPNQPGGDKPSAGSAGSAASEQHATRTPENGSARSNPTSGSTPGQAPAGRGPGPAAGPAARPGAAPPQHQGPRTQAQQGRPLPPQQGRPAAGAPGRQGPPQQAPADRAAGNQAPARSQPPGNPAPGNTAPADPAGNRAPASGAPVDGAQPVRGSQAPPWQRGMQREPQTNLKRPLQGQPGQPGSQQRPRPDSPSSAAAGAGTAAAAAGAPGAQKPSTTPPGAPTQAVPVQKGPPAAPKGQPAPTQGRPTGAAAAAAGGITGTAAAAAVSQRESAKAKASAIDGPTRHINRDVLPKDMPDLSEAKHPLPAAAATGQQPKVAAAPQRVEEGEALRATVQIRKVDPWSTLKISSVISVSLFFVWMVAVGLLYVVLDGMGVWDRLNNAFTDIVAESSSEGLVTAGQVFGYAAVIGLANMVLFTALATIGAFIYNLCSDLVGGVEVTLADRD